MSYSSGTFFHFICPQILCAVNTFREELKYCLNKKFKQCQQRQLSTDASVLYGCKSAITLTAILSSRDQRSTLKSKPCLPTNLWSLLRIRVEHQKHLCITKRIKAWGPFRDVKTIYRKQFSPQVFDRFLLLLIFIRPKRNSN